jgi:hypothetical protein
MFTLSSFLKITIVALIFGLLFSTVKEMQYFAKKWVGLYFGLFLTNSSGHPAPQAEAIPLDHAAGKSKSVF